MFKLAFRHFRHRRGRFMLVGLAIAFSVSLPVAATILKDGFLDSVEEAARRTPIPSAETIDVLIQEDSSFYKEEADRRYEAETGDSLELGEDFDGERYDEIYNGLRNEIFIDDNLLADISGRDDIASVAGTIEIAGSFIERIVSTTPAGTERELDMEWNQFGVSHTEHEPFNDYEIMAGRPPLGRSEIVLDHGSFAGEIRPGDTVRLEYDPSRYSGRFTEQETLEKEFEVVGFAELKTTGIFAETIAAGTDVFVFHIDDLRQLRDYPAGKLDFIKINLREGIDVSDLGMPESRAGFDLPAHALQNHGEFYEGYRDAVPYWEISKGSEFFESTLQAYINLTVLVSVFVIFNIFNSIFRQQAKEMALLRVIKLTRLSVFRLVAAQVLLVGLLTVTVGSAVGLGLGYLSTRFAQVFFSQLQGGLDLNLGWQTAVWPALGLLTVFAAGLLPAFRAARAKPLEALTTIDKPVRLSKVRIIVGLALLVISGLTIALFINDLQGDEYALLTAAGRLQLAGLMLIVTALLLLPALAKLLITVINGLLRPLLGSGGALVLGNISRQLNYLSINVSALAICATIIIAYIVFFNSALTSFDNDLPNLFQYDYYSFTRGTGEKAPKIEDAENLNFQRYLEGLDIGANNIRHSYMASVEPAAAENDEDDRYYTIIAADISREDTAYSSGVFWSEYHVNQTVSAAELDNLKNGQILVSQSLLVENDWRLGQTVELAYLDSDEVDRRRTYVIGGVFETHHNRESDRIFIVSRQQYLQGAGGQATYSASVIAFNVHSGASHDEVYSALDDLNDLAGDRLEVTPFPGRRAFEEERDRAYQEFLSELGKVSFVPLAIVAWGLASTLSLAVIERTREIGVLRSLGFSRRQIQVSVTAEALVITSIALSIAIGIGIFFGWGIYKLFATIGLSDILFDPDGSAVFDIPFVILLAYFAFSLLMAAIASLWPAIRAGRMDIVESITKP